MQSREKIKTSKQPISIRGARQAVKFKQGIDGEFIDNNGIPVTRRMMIRAALRKIEKQFPHTAENCPVSGESKLMFAILSEAAMSLACQSSQNLAIRYFKQGSVHAELCGVSGKWIEEVLESCGAFDPLQKK